MTSECVLSRGHLGGIVSGRAKIRGTRLYGPIQLLCRSLSLDKVLVLLTYLRGFTPIIPYPPLHPPRYSSTCSRSRGKFKHFLKMREGGKKVSTGDVSFNLFPSHLERWPQHKDTSSFGRLGDLRHILQGDQISVSTKGLCCCRLNDDSCSSLLIKNVKQQSDTERAIVGQVLHMSPTRLQNLAVPVASSLSHQTLPLFLPLFMAISRRILFPLRRAWVIIRLENAWRGNLLLINVFLTTMNLLSDKQGRYCPLTDVTYCKGEKSQTATHGHNFAPTSRC